MLTHSINHCGRKNLSSFKGRRKSDLFIGVISVDRVKNQNRCRESKGFSNSKKDKLWYDKRNKPTYVSILILVS